MNIYKYLLISSLLLFLPSCFLTLMPSLLFAQDLYNNTNTLLYANHLMRTHQYGLAIPELERLHFMNPADDSVQYNLMRAYIKNGNPHAAVQRIEAFYCNIDSIPLPMADFYLKSLLISKEYGKALDFISLYGNFSGDEKIKNRIITCFLSDAWKEAYTLYDFNREKYPSIGRYFENVINDSKTIIKKSPFVAGMLSTFIPASGKFYTGDWKDGLTGLILTGGFAYQSYRGFHKKGASSVLGWVFGSASFAFYAGNIYGSVKSARLFNNKQKKIIIDEVEHTFIKSF
ncbi:MAG: hypothetical protein HYY40_11610 [Bacteroidetes bacterium]|nr:hypothetical protein [Bacteroidota bacterium]